MVNIISSAKHVRIKESKGKKPQTYSVHKGWQREPFDRKKHF